MTTDEHIGDDDRPGPAEGFELVSEFARVHVSRSDSICGPRLLIVDVHSGQRRYLDPLELETVVWATDEDWREWLDPSRSRWANVAHDIGEDA